MIASNRSDYARRLESDRERLTLVCVCLHFYLSRSLSSIFVTFRRFSERTDDEDLFAFFMERASRCWWCRCSPTPTCEDSRAPMSPSACPTRRIPYPRGPSASVLSSEESLWYTIFYFIFFMNYAKLTTFSLRKLCALWTFCMYVECKNAILPWSANFSIPKSHSACSFE